MLARNRKRTIEILADLASDKSFSVNNDHRWEYKNGNAFTFLVDFGFEFSGDHTLVQPSLLVLNDSLSKNFRALSQGAGFGKQKLFPKAPNNLFYLFAYQGASAQSDFFDLAAVQAYLATLAEKFDSHCVGALAKIDDEKSLLDFLVSERLLRQPMGLVIEMFLASGFLSKKDFLEKYFPARPPLHKKYHEHILASYDQNDRLRQ